MQQLILNVREDSLPFLSELLSKFDFVEIVKPAKKGPAEKKWTKAEQRFYDELKDSFEQMELHRQGKIKLKTADELIQELWPT